MDDLNSCHLCEWRCGADRLRREQGVCRVGRAEVAATMCSDTLASYIVTLLGCCYRCLHCNTHRISQYPGVVVCRPYTRRDTGGQGARAYCRLQRETHPDDQFHGR